MRKVLKRAAIVVAILVVAAGGLAIFVAVRGIPSYAHPPVRFHVESTPQAVLHGRKLVRLLCMDCHFDPTTRALTGKRMRDVPAKFGTIFAPNITRMRLTGSDRGAMENSPSFFEQESGETEDTSRLT